MIKPTLTEWLIQLREDEEMEASGDDAVDADDEDDDRPIRWTSLPGFPSDEALKEFISTVDEFSQGDVDLILRHLLHPSCTIGKDEMLHDDYLWSRNKDDPHAQRIRDRLSTSLHFQRVVRFYSGETTELPWEGIRWILQLLPDYPATALAAIDAYFIAHMRDMTDPQMHAMSDAEAVIRARYIGVPETQEERRQALYDLSPRQFEVLVQQLYRRLGYDAELTPNTRDGGRDVIARRTQAGRAERVLIECKRHADNIDPLYVRALLGVVSNDRASAGKVVTTSFFSEETRNEMKDNHRIELIDGLQLVVLLNEHLGWTWPTHLDGLTSERNAPVPQRSDA